MVSDRMYILDSSFSLSCPAMPGLELNPLHSICALAGSQQLAVQFSPSTAAGEILELYHTLQLSTNIQLH